MLIILIRGRRLHHLGRHQVGLLVRRCQLEDVLGARQTPKVALTQITQHEPGWQPIPHHLLGRQRK